MSRVRMSKVRIPAQRGRRSGPAAHVIDLGRGTAPFVVVVPRQRSLSGRLALACARAVWERRYSWAPVWAGVGLFTFTGVLSLSVPGLAPVLGVPAVLLPAGWWAIARRHSRSAVRRRARAQFRSVLGLSGVLAWSAAAVWFGPAGAALAATWLLGTAAAQVAWSQQRRRKTPTPAPVTESIVQD